MRIPILLGLLAVTPAFSDTFSFSIDTSSLIANPNGPFTLDFQFIDGGGTGDGNNTITLSNFSDPASLTVVPSSETAGVTLDGSPFGLTMTDNSFFNEISFLLVPSHRLALDLTPRIIPRPAHRTRLSWTCLIALSITSQPPIQMGSR